MATPKDFAKALLNRLGLSQTDNRIVSLVAFAGIEGGHWHNPARFNPFNTMLDAPGAEQAPGLLHGIKAYADWPSGIDATARTMLQGNMRPIMDALNADADPQDFLASISQSKWCPGCPAYEQSNARALYQYHANEQDSDHTSLSTFSPLAIARAHPLLALLGILAATGGIIYLITKRSPLELIPGFAHENPARKRKRRRGKTHVQSLLFPRSRFTTAEAKSWARSHGYRAGKVDTTARYVRLRQSDPSKFARMRTIKFGSSGIKAVVGARA